MLHRWRFAWAWFIGATLIAGCGIKPPPVVEPTPPPPPIEECMAGVPWCGDVGQTCSTAENPCKHNPTQDPNHCELAPSCPPVEPPEEPPTEPPATECAPVLDPTRSAPIAPDSAWPKAQDQSLPTEWKQDVWKAVQKAQQACPAAWVGNCMRGGPGAIDQGYLLISKELQIAGGYASQGQTPSGERKDHLWVRRSSSSNDWNATKLFFYGNGCLITGDGAFTAHGWYTYVGSETTPPPEPPPVAGCSDPLPPKVWTAGTLPPGWGSDEIGKPRWVLGCKPHNNVIDCTAKVEPRACDYCASIGMGDIGGQQRCGCPVRNECPGFKCEERQACEAYLTGGTKLEAKQGSGATCAFAHGNPFQFWPSGGNCRLCSVGDPRVCGGWF
jgi:hypothetical protein